MSEPVSLTLASNSPRRRQLLALGGWRFSVLPAEVDESPLPGERPDEYVLRLAEAKARAAAREAPRDALLLAADTAVVDGDEILGKPSDAQEAVQMLKRLRGHTHRVYTALALLRKSDGCASSGLTVTDVPMRHYSDWEIAAYVQSGDPLDKAGAYGIQHPVFRPVQGLKGCFASVMGLPLCHLTVLLRQFGLFPLTDVARRCQDEIGYACPVARAILLGEGALDKGEE
jgi:septum formation protein